MGSSVTLIPIEGMPEVTPGDDVGALIVSAVADQRTPLQDGDVLVVTQKVVSKAEGRIVDLRTITPSPKAADFASRWEKDARVVEVALAEAVRVVRMEPGPG